MLFIFPPTSLKTFYYTGGGGGNNIVIVIMIQLSVRSRVRTKSSSSQLFETVSTAF